MAVGCWFTPAAGAEYSAVISCGAGQFISEAGASVSLIGGWATLYGSIACSLAGGVRWIAAGDWGSTPTGRGASFRNTARGPAKLALAFELNGATSKVRGGGEVFVKLFGGRRDGKDV